MPGTVRFTARFTPRFTGRGFTIVEVMFSLGIIALLIGLLLVGVNAMNRGARRAVEQQNVASLKMAVDHFQSTFGFLPPLVYDGRDSAQPSPQGITASGPLADRLVGGISRPAPVVYNPENQADWNFLRGEPENAAHLRFSTHSLAYYLLGALGEEVDGVQGPGFRTPLPDGSFRVSGGQRTEPLFDVSKNPEGLYREDVEEGRVELRDRNGVAYRYYRWLPGDRDGVVENWEDLNVPSALYSEYNAGEGRWILGDDVQLRSAKFAIVGAGPNGAFGEIDSEGGAAELASKLGMSASEPEDKLEQAGRQDNIVEVGR